MNLPNDDTLNPRAEATVVMYNKVIVKEENDHSHQQGSFVVIL